MMTTTQQPLTVSAWRRWGKGLLNLHEHWQKVRHWSERFALSLTPTRVPLNMLGPELLGFPFALSAADAAGIALIGQRVAVINDRSEAFSNARWSGLSRDDITVVAPTAADGSVEIAIRLLSNGRKAQTPVAFVHIGNNADPLVSVTSLGDVSLRGCPFERPTVMIVGEIAGSARATPLRPLLTQ